MVERITIFEPHFDDAQIGPTALPSPSNDDGSASTTGQAGGSRSKFVLAAGVFVVLALAVAVLSRRRSADDSADQSADVSVAERVGVR